MHLCSFSGSVSNVKNKSDENLLRALAVSGRVSCWDMSENSLWSYMQGLERRGLIVTGPELGYPWLNFVLTDEGKALITPESLPKSPPTEKENQIAWFKSLLESLQQGDTETAIEAVRGAVKLLERQK